MGKKMKLPFLSNQTTTEPKSTTWPWPSCTQTRTLSFRIGSNDNSIIKTVNSAFIDSSTATEPLAESFFTNSSESASFSTNSDDPPSAGAGSGDPVEAVIQGLRSTESRLFFEPGETSASILEEAIKKEEELLVLDSSDIKKVIPYKESVALSMESRNPYLDFKKSMEEMVEAHGIKGWESLEQLLGCYLKMNGKDNHGFIVGAFVDLLVGLAFSNININNKSSSSPSSSSNCTCSTNCGSPYSPLSFCNTSSSSSSFSSSSLSSTPCVSSIEVGEIEIESTTCLASLLEIEEEKNVEEEDDDDDDDVVSS